MLQSYLYILLKALYEKATQSYITKRRLLLTKSYFVSEGLRGSSLVNRLSTSVLTLKLWPTGWQHACAGVADTDHLWGGDVRNSECLASWSHLHSCLRKWWTPSRRLTHKHQPTWAPAHQACSHSRVPEPYASNFFLRFSTWNMLKYH